LLADAGCSERRGISLLDGANIGLKNNKLSLLIHNLACSLFNNNNHYHL